MTVELKPETERLVREEIQSGHFQSIDDLLTRAIQVMREKDPPAPRRLRKNFAQFLMESPLRGSGLNLERQKDYPRPIEL
jgi:Arc/MetJ-type ribon-helix-helix transcriptional regulator